jgi:Ca2+-binding RTX toxin-like protein
MPKPTAFAGTAGDDTAVFSIVPKQNVSMDGGAGSDTLQLRFTAAEWARADIQADLVKLEAYLDAGGNEHGGRGEGVFKFKAFKLDVTNFEKFSVFVDGVQVLPVPSGVNLRGVNDTGNTLDGTSGNDTLTGGDFVTLVQFGQLQNGLAGGDGDDLLRGGNLLVVNPFMQSVNNILDGGAGNDTLVSGTGFWVYNTMTGGAGDDIFYIAAPDPLTAPFLLTASITDFTHGEDKIVIGARPGLVAGSQPTVMTIDSRDYHVGPASPQLYYSLEEQALLYDPDGGEAGNANVLIYVQAGNGFSAGEVLIG